MVTEGKVTKGCGIRVIRKGKIVHVGILDSLRRVKEIVKEVWICSSFTFHFYYFYIKGQICKKLRNVKLIIVHFHMLLAITNGDMG